MNAVYRCYDERGRLLYVGQSINPLGRLVQHGRAEWIGRVSHIYITRCVTRRDALNLERLTIEREKPLFNLQYTERTKKPGRPTVGAEVESLIRTARARGLGLRKIATLVGVGTSVVQRVCAGVESHQK